MQCVICGCSENNPCVKRRRGPCSWMLGEPPICSFCGEDVLRTKPTTADESVIYFALLRVNAVRQPSI